MWWAVGGIVALALSCIAGWWLHHRGTVLTETLVLTVDVTQMSADEIAKVFIALDSLHKAVGGGGLELGECKHLREELVQWTVRSRGGGTKTWDKFARQLERVFRK